MKRTAARSEKTMTCLALRQLACWGEVAFGSALLGLGPVGDHHGSMAKQLHIRECCFIIPTFSDSADLMSRYENLRSKA